MREAGEEEGNGKGGKSNGNVKEDGNGGNNSNNHNNSDNKD
jgi:hypothetical protein